MPPPLEYKILNEASEASDGFTLVRFARDPREGDEARFRIDKRNYDAVFCETHGGMWRAASGAIVAVPDSTTTRLLGWSGGRLAFGEMQEMCAGTDMFVKDLDVATGRHTAFMAFSYSEGSRPETGGLDWGDLVDAGMVIFPLTLEEMRATKAVSHPSLVETGFIPE